MPFPEEPLPPYSAVAFPPSLLFLPSPGPVLLPRTVQDKGEFGPPGPRPGIGGEGLHHFCKPTARQDSPYPSLPPSSDSTISADQEYGEGSSKGTVQAPHSPPDPAAVSGSPTSTSAESSEGGPSTQV